MTLIGFMLAAAAAVFSSAPAKPASCSQGGDMRRICGIPAPEDLVQIPGTSWVVASSMPRDGSAGGLFLIDSRTLRATRVALDGSRARFASTATEAEAVTACAPPDFRRLVTHGVAIRRGKGGVHPLYVVGHGGREAIELFNVDVRGATPTIRWAGCVPMPTGLEANSVVGLPGGGLMFTSLYDSGETAWSARIGKLAAAAPAGGVYEWHAIGGVRRVTTPVMSGPNGIAVSADGKAVYLAGWGDRMLRKIDRAGRETAPAVKLDFLPDNLHWAPDGSLLASGQRIAVGELFGCASQKNPPAYCARSWSVARINANALTLANDWHDETGEDFGDSTAAIMVRGQLWIGSINGDCIAVLAAPARAKSTGRDRR